jgi:hypothetical protein
MKPEELVELVKGALGANLRGIVLYGSAATGEFVANRSDYNILVTTERLTLEDLEKLAGPIARWTKAGNPPPLCFTADRFRDSADVFPLEFLDIQESHRLLHGDDPVRDLAVSSAHLRHQLEYDLKSKMLLLRRRILAEGAAVKRLTALMVDSISAFLALFRGALRLFESNIPATKLEAVDRLAQRLDFAPDVFRTVSELKNGTRLAKDMDVRALFDRYLQTIERVVDAVDHHLRSQPESR